MIFTW